MGYAIKQQLSQAMKTHDIIKSSRFEVFWTEKQPFLEFQNAINNGLKSG